MKVNTSVLEELPFDQFTRLTIAKRMIENNIGSDFKVLDIGGYKGNTNKFFNNVTVLDVFDVKGDDYIKGSALDLPFKDGEFDVVTSFDVLEHISKKDRDKFIKEALRVTKNIFLLAAPFNTPVNVLAEKNLNNFYKAMTGESHRWLNEHIENGLPDTIDSKLKNLGVSFIKQPTNNIVLWSLLQHLMFFEAANYNDEKVGDITLFYNKNFIELGDLEGPAYRQIYLISKTSKDLKNPFDKSVVNTELKISMINDIFIAIDSIKNMILKEGLYPLEVKNEKLEHENSAHVGNILNSQKSKTSKTYRRVKKLTKNIFIKK